MKRQLLILVLLTSACASSAPGPIAQRTSAPKAPAEEALPLAQTLPIMDAARPMLFSSKGGKGASPAIIRPTAKRLVPRLLAENLDGPLAQRAALEAQFDGYIQSYEDRVKSRGGRQYDLARAAGFFIAAAYYAASDGIELSQAQADPLRLALEASVPASNAFKNASESDKQKAYETFVALGQFFANEYDTAAQAGDAARKARLRDAARQHLTRLTGAPYERLRFTERGLEF